MVTYKHTQIGYLMLIILAAVALFYFWLYGVIADEAGRVPAVAVMCFIIFILASFSSLTVTVDKNFLRIRFGYGIFQKKFPLGEIASAKTVKNHWYYGWGIRLWLWPQTWIYNVSGFDAVEIIMKNGKIYRIGTDAPKELEAAIKKAKDFELRED